MKFLCDSCGTKYSISDERVRGRVLKIRCKKCDFVITVREDVGAGAGAVEVSAPVAAPAATSPIATSPIAAPLEYAPEEQTMLGEMPPMTGAAAAMPAKGAAPALPAEGDDWFLSFDGEQEGPFSLFRALDRLRKMETSGKEAHAWRPGFLVWLPVEEVPELGSVSAARRQPRPVIPTPVAPRVSSPGIAKDPSGPRAALSVSAGTRDPSDAARVQPAAPAQAALATKPNVLKTEAVHSMFGGSQLSDDPPSLDNSALEEDGEGEQDEPEAPSRHEGSIDLNISNEASGLVNLAHLAAAQMGGKPAGPVMLNGHTARQQKFKSEALEALDAPEPATAVAAPPPVVVVAAAAPSGGTSAAFKYIALVAIPLVLGLAALVVYLLIHKPAAETIIVTEPSRHIDDSIIVENDPNFQHGGGPVDPKHPAAPHKFAPGVKGPVAVAGPVKPGTAPTGSQQALANLYDDDVVAHQVQAVQGRQAEQGGQVSQQAILGVVSANKRQLSLCFERALKHDASLKSGRVPIQVTVGMSGRVNNVTIPAPQYASSELGQCFVGAVKRWTFPASDAQYTTEFPFILQGQ